MRLSRNCNGRSGVRRPARRREIKTVIAATKASVARVVEPRKCLKSERYTTCSIGGCERPEYLRQGAVSCWGAGSPAKSGGIVMVTVPLFFLQSALSVLRSDPFRRRHLP